MNVELRSEMADFMGMKVEEEQQNLLFEMRGHTNHTTGVFYMPVTVACQGPAWLRDVMFIDTTTTNRYSDQPIVVSDEDTVLDFANKLLGQVEDDILIDVLLVWHFATCRDKHRFLGDGKWIDAEWVRFEFINKP